MENLSIAVGVIVILACISAMIVSFKNYAIIKGNFEINMISSMFIGICDNFVRSIESLRRKNDGDNPCDMREKIEFINYFRDSNIFY